MPPWAIPRCTTSTFWSCAAFPRRRRVWSAPSHMINSSKMSSALAYWAVPEQRDQLWRLLAQNRKTDWICWAASHIGWIKAFLPALFLFPLCLCLCLSLSRSVPLCIFCLVFVQRHSLSHVRHSLTLSYTQTLQLANLVRWCVLLHTSRVVDDIIIATHIIRIA